MVCFVVLFFCARDDWLNWAKWPQPDFEFDKHQCEIESQSDHLLESTDKEIVYPSHL